MQYYVIVRKDNLETILTELRKLSKSTEDLGLLITRGSRVDFFKKFNITGSGLQSPHWSYDSTLCVFLDTDLKTNTLVPLDTDTIVHADEYEPLKHRFLVEYRKVIDQNRENLISRSEIP